MPKTITTEACANCGDVIGKLETPHVWKENVVCARCYAKLNTAPPLVIVHAQPAILAQESKPPPLNYRIPAVGRAKPDTMGYKPLVAIFLFVLAILITLAKLSGADGGDVGSIIGTLVGIAVVIAIIVWIVKLSGAVMASGEAAKQQSKK